VANNYNKYIITDLLRNKYHYDGVVCTDWLVTGDETVINSFLSGKSWGMEKATIAERHYKILMAGVDQFGGNNDMAPVLEAYKMGVKEHGEAFMRGRFEQSAVRLLRGSFRTGLFENPYLDVEVTKENSRQSRIYECGLPGTAKIDSNAEEQGECIAIANGQNRLRA
jgi:beta-glucosidase